MATFVISLTYSKPMDVVEARTDDHRAYMGQLFNDGVLLASGPYNPRTGGMLILNAEDLDAVNALLAKDPFYTEGVADYDIREWRPTTGGARFN